MPRANVKDKRKAQLIAATIESIGKRGLQETTITHISKGAGMSRGIINFYFTSKEAMLQETLRTLVDEYAAIWQDAVPAEKGFKGQVKLEALIDAHFSKKLCQAKRLNVMSAFWGHAATHAAYRDLLQASDRQFEAALQDAWKQAGLTEQEAPQVARQNHALIRGLWLAFMLSPQETDRDALAQECRAFVADRLGAGSKQPRKQVAERAAQPGNVTPISAAKPQAVKKPAKPGDGQMDIEDLFAGL